MPWVILPPNGVPWGERPNPARRQKPFVTRLLLRSVCVMRVTLRKGMRGPTRGESGPGWFSYAVAPAVTSESWPLIGCGPRAASSSR